jgi:3-oxoacyl-[acyl-carrier-protein] synthase-3
MEAGIKARPSIIGTGSYLPERIIPNRQIEEEIGMPYGAVKRRTGITERRWAADHEATSDLATRAAEKALKEAATGPGEIDLIIVTTTSPDMVFPSTACLVQRNINARNAAAFDVSASCSGFIYGLSIADSYIRSGSARRILLVSSEVKSRFISRSDPSTYMIFGDGAGAVVIGNGNDESGILSVRVSSDGSRSDIIELQGGGSRNPISDMTLKIGLHFVKMKGGRLFKVAVKKLYEEISDLVKENGIGLCDIDQFIIHQANLRILQAVAERLGIEEEKVFISLDQIGNTSSSSIPIALDMAARGGRIKRGDLVLLAAFGGGLTWGSALVRW